MKTTHDLEHDLVMTVSEIEHALDRASIIPRQLEAWKTRMFALVRRSEDAIEVLDGRASPAHTNAHDAMLAAGLLERVKLGPDSSKNEIEDVIRYVEIQLVKLRVYLQVSKAPNFQELARGYQAAWANHRANMRIR